MAETEWDVEGKGCLVTGGTSGIGLVTARELAIRGARVAVVGRDAGRGEKAISYMRETSGNNAVTFLKADLSSQEEIRGLAEEVDNYFSHLHVLVNNAGTYLFTRKFTVDGIEMTFAVNHLAYFLLTQLLLEKLISSGPARVINVSSEAHRRASMDFDQLEGGFLFNGIKAYGQSKLANVLFTYELARRLEGKRVTVNALHPGFTSTNIGKDNGRLLHFFIRLALQTGISAEEGAETSIYLATSSEVEGVTGKYFVRCKPIPSSQESYDVDAAHRLWQLSEEMTGIRERAKAPSS